MRNRTVAGLLSFSLLLASGCSAIGTRVPAALISTPLGNVEPAEALGCISRGLHERGYTVARGEGMLEATQELESGALGTDRTARILIQLFPGEEGEVLLRLDAATDVRRTGGVHRIEPADPQVEEDARDTLEGCGMYL